jgi:ABC-type nitrate/sulfonate/bicarbonate transport system substrate-binding protein
MADLLNGRLDISFGNYVSFIAAQAAGVASLRILAEGNNATAHELEIVVPPHSPVTSVAELRGKTIAVNALANVATLIVSSILAENNVPPASVRFTAIPFPQMAAALNARRVDAAWMVDPFLTEAEVRNGVVELADGDQSATQNFPNLRLRGHDGLGQEVPGNSRGVRSGADPWPAGRRHGPGDGRARPASIHPHHPAGRGTRGHR